MWRLLRLFKKGKNTKSCGCSGVCSYETPRCVEAFPGEFDRSEEMRLARLVYDPTPDPEP